MVRKPALLLPVSRVPVERGPAEAGEARCIDLWRASYEQRERESGMREKCRAKNGERWRVDWWVPCRSPSPGRLSDMEGDDEPSDDRQQNQPLTNKRKTPRERKVGVERQSIVLVPSCDSLADVPWA